MRRYAGIVVLCGLLVIPALLFARAPAPRPRPDTVAEASAAVAERLLVKEYGADAEGVKGARVKFAFLATRENSRSETGKTQDLFAIAAEEVSYSGDGWLTVRNARYVRHHCSPTVFDGKQYTGWTSSCSELTMLRFQFASPVRRLQDIHKSQLKKFTFGGGHSDGFHNARVELIAKKIAD